MIEMDYSTETKRDILCIDVKSFFASVESVKRGLNPLTSELVVMSREGNKGGLVLAASPMVKKKYGLKTGSRQFEFPKNHQIIIAPPRMGLYVKVNRLINNIFKEFATTEDVFPYSIDEAFLDITASKHLFGETTEEVAKRIQERIWNEMRIPVAVGIGDNPLLAKLALDNEAKDNVSQIAYWSYERVSETIWQIEKLTDMWRIGRKTAQRLKNMGIETVYDLSQFDEEKLKNRLGMIGQQLYYHSHGIYRSVIAQQKYLVPKSRSIGGSQILSRDYTDIKEIELIIKEMTMTLSVRLRTLKKQPNVIKLLIGHSKDTTDKMINRQMKITPTDSTTKLTELFLELFERHYKGKPVRTIGLSFCELGDPVYPQLNLFESAEGLEKDTKIDRVMDEIKMAMGQSAIFKGNSLQKAGTYLKRTKLLGGHQREEESGS